MPATEGIENLQISFIREKTPPVIQEKQTPIQTYILLFFHMSQGGALNHKGFCATKN